MKTNKGIMHFLKNAPLPKEPSKPLTKGKAFLEDHLEELFPPLPEDEEIVTRDGIHFWTMKKADRRKDDGLYGESNHPTKVGS